jgi:hypothetical protein
MLNRILKHNSCQKVSNLINNYEKIVNKIIEVQINIRNEG